MRHFLGYNFKFQTGFEVQWTGVERERLVKLLHKFDYCHNKSVFVNIILNELAPAASPLRQAEIHKFLLSKNIFDTFLIKSSFEMCLIASLLLCFRCCKRKGNRRHIRLSKTASLHFSRGL